MNQSLNASVCMLLFTTILISAVGCSQNEIVDEPINEPTLFQVSLDQGNTPLLQGDVVDCIILLKLRAARATSKDPVLVKLVKGTSSFGSWEAEDQSSDEPETRKLLSKITLPQQPGTYELVATMFHNRKAEAEDQVFESQKVAITVSKRQ